MKFIFGIIGAYIGALIDSYSGFFFGAGIGFIFGYVLELKKNLREIEDKLKLIQSNLIDSNVMVDETVSEGVEVDNVDIEEIEITQQAVDTEEDTQLNPSLYKSNSSETDDVISKDQKEAEPEVISEQKNKDDAWIESDANINQKEYPIDKLSNYIKNFFMTGNVVVKVGIIILFFGVAFLLKYAAQKHALPVELWFIGVSLGAIGLLVFGWKLRNSNTTYALVIQGGAVGMLYITIFAAASERFQLLPLGFTFFVMCALVVLSCYLAVLQNARSLACLATIGGFLAPVLTSSGSGSHIALFSYYAALNAGIFAIAWFKAWRVLNWLGFVFTFVIASLWGHESYQAQYFNTTEPFLILFFLFYVIISILFAYKQPPNLKGLVDGSLVFGVPLVGFALQSQLVNQFEFGQAYSALGMSVIYILLARWLWNQQVKGMRLLTESFIALGVIFGSLAIPFVLDGNWTAAAWALEGAGISWVGIRQKRLLARLFGVLLQVGGGLIFLASNIPSYDTIPVFNSAYIGSFLLSVGGLFSAYQFYKYKASLKDAEQPLHWMLLAWGLAWWFGAGLNEINDFISSRYELNVSLIFITLSLLMLSLIARSVSWKAAEFPAILLLPAMYLACFIHLVDTPSRNLLSHYGFISWILAFFVQMLVLYRCEWIWNRKLLAVWHAFTMYLYVFVCCFIIADFVDDTLRSASVWHDIIWGVIPAFGIMKMIYLRDRLSWPVMDYPQSYLGKGLFPIIAYLAFWILFSCGYTGDPTPLPYIAVINPLELTQLFSLLMIFKWLHLMQREEIPKINILSPSVAYASVALIGFIWINSVVAHSVHFYAGVRFSETAMMRSEIFQTSISIVWTLTAFIIMWLGSRNLSRKVWYIGVGLLGMVVLKLFMIDLADSGTVTRIISFMSVGILMLIIGYLSPRPPLESKEE